MSLQEKFQIVSPYSKKEDDGDKWQSFDSARVSESDGEQFNIMPPGMDISQPNARIEKMPLSTAGATDVSDDVSTESMQKGYARRELASAEEQYTGEQVDLFYGEAVDESGFVGFAERNNYLDRI